MLHEALKKLGIFYSRRRHMAIGIDWLWDIERIRGSSAINQILDVGANEGQTAASFGTNFPNATIHSFEPIAATYENLVRNVGKRNNTFCYNMAVGANRGIAKMAVGENSLLNRVVNEHSVANDVETLENVRLETVDDFCMERNIAHVDILKIDVEGAELGVVKGASRMFKERRISYAFVEIGFDRKDTGHTYAPDLIRHLDESGLGLYGIYEYNRLKPPDYAKSGTLPVFANALFVRK